MNLIISERINLKIMRWGCIWLANTKLVYVKQVSWHVTPHHHLYINNKLLLPESHLNSMPNINKINLLLWLNPVTRYKTGQLLDTTLTRTCSSLTLVEAESNTIVSLKLYNPMTCSALSWKESCKLFKISCHAP